jgi:predicted transcriptional regulator
MRVLGLRASRLAVFRHVTVGRSSLLGVWKYVRGLADVVVVVICLF